MRRRALRVVVVACLAAVTYGMLAAFGGFEYAAVGSPASSAQYQYDQGTAVVGVPSGQLACLNLLRTPCQQPQTFSTAGVALAGAYRIRPDLSYEPVLVDDVEVETPSKKRPFALTYHIKEAAVWSDGTPVSADDFIFTRDVIVDPANEIADRLGYDRIVEAARIDEKTVRFVLSEPYAPWRTLFPAVLPKHVLEGKDFDQVWFNDIADPDTSEPVGSGPFLVTDFVPGFPGWLTLSRNAMWWGAQPSLDAVVFRFTTENELIQFIKDGEVDVLSMPTLGQQLAQLAELRGYPGLVTDSNPTFGFEHLDFNLGAATMPLLREQWFRNAFAHSIDRAALVTELFGAFDPDVEPSQNLFYTPNQAEYEAHFDKYAYKPQKVAGLMSDHGCVRGGDGIWVCGAVRASIKYATTSGNPRRAVIQQELQADARNAGIELVFDNSPPGFLFGTRLPARDYELVMFTWLNAPDPSGLAQVYKCAGASNFMSYCSKKVDDLLTASDTELDPNKRSSLVNKADATLANDVPTIPLYQHLTFLAFRNVMQGIVDNVVFSEGVTWNVEDWRKS